MIASYDVMVLGFHDALQAKAKAEGRSLAIETLAQDLAIICAYHLEVETWILREDLPAANGLGNLEEV